MTRPTIVFLGESPPANAKPGFRPFDCDSGTRLARVLGLRRGRVAVVETLQPRNLFALPRGVKGAPAWDEHEAEAAAALVWAWLPAGSVVVCMGERVLAAVSKFNERSRVLALPHPSGASPLLNTPAQRRDARRVVLPALVHLGPFVPEDFDLDDETVRVDLATAAYPKDPARALAVLDPAAPATRFDPTRRLLPFWDWRAWLDAVVVFRKERDEAERARRASAMVAGCPADAGTSWLELGLELSGDRLYRHWCMSELRACERALYEAEANEVFDRKKAAEPRP